MDKGTTFAEQLAGCLRVKEAGLQICCYYMPGLGGKRWSEKHARDTGQLIRAIAPHHVRLRTCFVLEGTPLADEYRAGRFEPLSEEECMQEIGLFLEQLQETETEVISDHRINLLMELRGHLPQDYARLQGIIARYQALSAENRALFVAGRRLGLIRRLDEFSDAANVGRIVAEQHQYHQQTPVPASMLY